MAAAVSRLTAILDIYSPDEVEDLIRRATPEQRQIILPVLLPELDSVQQRLKYDWRTCSHHECDGLPHEGMNRRHARPSQIPPDGNWLIWMLRAGRGYGKTRVGAETSKAWAGYNPDLPNVESMPGSRGAIVAATFADARDTCIEGDSGLLSVLPESAIKTWNRSMGELVLSNGTRIKCFSAEEPERLRGPQFHWGWCDELAAWTRPEAWDQLMFGLRLGSEPKVVVTTTPKPTKLVRDLDARETVHVTHGSTFENAANLAPAALDELRRRYEGTRLGEQELFAKILTDTPGALWTADVLSGSRVSEVPRVNRRVLAVDPSDGEEKGDGYGVTVACLGEDGHGYVEINEEWHNSVDQMASATIELAHDTGCGVIVVEKNHGGKWIPALLRKYDPKMKIEDVWAADGKTTRAEPISAFFANRDDFPATAHLVGRHEELEDQLTNYTGKPGEKSPDRLDSMVWALTYLMLPQRKQRPKLVCV